MDKRQAALCLHGPGLSRKLPVSCGRNGPAIEEISAGEGMHAKYLDEGAVRITV